MNPRLRRPKVRFADCTPSSRVYADDIAPPSCGPDRLPRATNCPAFLIARHPHGSPPAQSAKADFGPL
jgi:hypothetical protein